MKTVTTDKGVFKIDEDRDAKMLKLLVESDGNHDKEMDFLLQKILTPGMTVVDIGAHIGTTAIPFAKKVRKVIAFEPMAENRKYLEENIILNNLTNVTVYPYALGKVAMKAKAVLKNPHSLATYMVAESGEGDDVEIRTLSEVVGDTKIDFIKIDVEGMEPAVLAGAEQSIEKDKPVVFFEVNIAGLREHGYSVGIISRFFKRQGYSFFMITKDGLQRLPGLTLVAALKEPRTFFLQQKGGVFNLVAMPSETYSYFSVVKNTVKLFTEMCKRVYTRIL